jgi:hypothetical protein
MPLRFFLTFFADFVVAFQVWDEDGNKYGYSYDISQFFSPRQGAGQA